MDLSKKRSDSATGQLVSKLKSMADGNGNGNGAKDNLVALLNSGFKMFSGSGALKKKIKSKSVRFCLRKFPSRLPFCRKLAGDVSGVGSVGVGIPMLIKDAILYDRPNSFAFLKEVICPSVLELQQEGNPGFKESLDVILGLVLDINIKQLMKLDYEKFHEIVASKFVEKGSTIAKTAASKASDILRDKYEYSDFFDEEDDNNEENANDEDNDEDEDNEENANDEDDDDDESQEDDDSSSSSDETLVTFKINKNFVTSLCKSLK
jgi:hypothetical protein